MSRSVGQSTAARLKMAWPGLWPSWERNARKGLVREPGGCLVSRKRGCGKGRPPAVTVQYPGGRSVLLVRQVTYLASGRELPPGHELKNLCGRTDCALPEHHAAVPFRRWLEPDGDTFLRLYGAAFDASPAADVFVEKAACGGPCRAWLGQIADKAYGKFALPGGKGHGHMASMLAHRASFLRHNGWLPPVVDEDGALTGDTVGHACDIPWCVHPGHLGVETSSVQAGKSKRRGHVPVGIECLLDILGDIFLACEDGRRSGCGWELAGVFPAGPLKPLGLMKDRLCSRGEGVMA